MTPNELAEAMESLGAVRRGRFWHVATPEGPIEWEVKTNRGRSKFAYVAVDRIFTPYDAPPTAAAWAEANLWPIIRAGVERHGSRRSAGYHLPHCHGSYSYAHVHKEDLERFLRLWVPQETVWQAEKYDPSDKWKAAR